MASTITSPRRSALSKNGKRANTITLETFDHAFTPAMLPFLEHHGEALEAWRVVQLGVPLGGNARHAKASSWRSSERGLLPGSHHALSGGCRDLPARVKHTASIVTALAQPD